ncbi:hypothetical protein ACI48D_21375 [Massilia sp. LXY-6]|uniref:glucosamine inositolphosphorylceramide transferase family protein n=1 Tax=Massilia sp. LXY-6 TaxID=3379823 RepID=UPI003EE11E54
MDSVRVGLLIDDLVMPAWQYRVIELVLRVPGISTVLVIADGRRERGVRAPRQASGKRLGPGNAGSLLFDIWKKVDKRVFIMEADAFRQVDASRLLDGIPLLRSHAGRAPATGKPVYDEIARHSPTVLLQLGATEPAPEITRMAPCGVWALRIGEHPACSAEEQGLSEVLLDRRVVPAVVYMRRMVGGTLHEVGIYRSWSATNRLSLYRTVNRCCWKGASFFPRLLRRLAQVGPAAFIAEHVERNPDQVQAPASCPAWQRDNVPVALLGSLLRRLLSAGVSRLLFREQWFLLYRSGGMASLPSIVQGLKPLMPPKDRFWADPCVVRYRGRRAVFIEELEYAKKNGHISVIEFDKDGTPSLPPVKVLEKPHHLSYPFVFEDDGELFMIPESHQSRSVEIYRCTRFPDQWVWVMNLMENVIVVDPTLWRHNGKYWLFVNMMEQDGCSTVDELFLYWSDSLLSTQWVAHPANPIVTDARRARPAGRIFEHDGHWYRPSQDCSGAYGRAICVNRIDMISEHAYRETPLWYIEPDGGKRDCRAHTLALSDDLICADAMTLRSKMGLVRARLPPVLRATPFPWREY